MNLAPSTAASAFFKFPVDKESLSKTAHQSGDYSTPYHCCFCGSGNIIGLADGSIRCGFCSVVFIVQVQPDFSAYPQTDPTTGQPIQQQGPGYAPADQDPAAAPQGAPEDPQAPDFSDQYDDSEEEPEEPLTKASFRTHTGAQLDITAYMQYLSEVVPNFHLATSTRWGTLARNFNPLVKNANMGDRRPSYGSMADRVSDPEESQKHLQNAVNRAVPAITMPGDALRSVLTGEGKFRNQHETGRSNGLYEPQTRRQNEGHHFGYPAKQPPEARPLFGYLTEDPEKHNSSYSYGEHSVVLKKDKVWHRTTAMLGDSLADENDATPSPVKNISMHSLPRTTGKYEINGGNPVRPDIKRHHDEYMKNFSVDSPQRHLQHSYFEAQYHGGLDLDDVDHVVLRDKKYPRASVDELKQHLDRHGIPWVHVSNEGEHMSSSDGFKKAAGLNAKNVKVIAQQGGRFLLDAGENHNGKKMARVADTESGQLHEPLHIHSVLARGYWEEPTNIDAESILRQIH